MDHCKSWDELSIWWKTSFGIRDINGIIPWKLPLKPLYIVRYQHWLLMDVGKSDRDIENSAAIWCQGLFLSFSLFVQEHWEKEFFYLLGWKCASLDKAHKKNSRQAFLLVEFSRTLDHSSEYIQTEESEGNTEKLVIRVRVTLKYFKANNLNAYNLWKLCLL